MWSWSGSLGEAVFCFLGRGLDGSIESIRRAVDLPAVKLSWLRQVHSDGLVEATVGCSGTADALYTHRNDLALVIQTADCVPIVAAQGTLSLAIHAGWRGLGAGIIRRSLRQLTTDAVGGPPLTAAIGPTIGVCCYEVGDDVAQRVAASVGEDAVVQQTGRSRPHLDLRRAAHIELRRAGVEVLHEAVECTRCHGEQLWSYRGHSSSEGRNFSLIWSARRTRPSG